MIDILVVEDNDELRDVLERFLLHEGYQTRCVQRGDDALTLLQQEKVRLLLVDIMLPDMDGFRICTQARQSSNLPIIIMSARTQTSDQLLGYELGADDYVEKPFAMAVMLAKIKAQLRRGYEMQEERNVLKDDDLLVDIERRNVTLKGKQLALSVKEFELLVLLLDSAVAFVVSLLVVRFLMNYIRKHDFTAFGWYRIVLGLVVILTLVVLK